MQVTRTIPILRIFSVEKAREFYVDYLGFAIEWDHRFDENSPAYIQVRRDDLVLHLTEHHGDCCPGSSFSSRWRASSICIGSFEPRRIAI